MLVNQKHQDTATVQNLVPFRTSAVFCFNCGMMLRLDSHSSQAECRFCKEITKISGM